MTHTTKNLIMSLAIVYGFGAIGMALKVPDRIQNHLAPLHTEVK